MLRRAWHAQVFLILATFEVEVFHTGVGVGVRSVETYTFQSRTMKLKSRWWDNSTLPGWRCPHSWVG